MGEELGWRGFLLPKLLPIGQWKAILVSGLIWGFWHAPVIAQGHNFPRHPYWGILVMMFACMLLGGIILALSQDTQPMGCRAGAWIGQRLGRAAVGLSPPWL